MRLYDIHTHRPPADPSELAVVSVDASEPFAPLPEGCYAVGIHPWHAVADRLPLLRSRAVHPQVRRASIDWLRLRWRYKSNSSRRR